MGARVLKDLMREIESATVADGAVGLWWLGQAGFAFKASSGRLVVLDPYLSDACERLHGFKRLSLAPVTAEQIRADLLVITHEHTDHLDVDAVPRIAVANPGCLFAAPAGCDEGLEAVGVGADRRRLLAPGQTCQVQGVTIHSVLADHGDYSPTALSVLLDFGGVRVLCPGDTSLRPERMAPLYALQPDVLLPPINGQFGNMNHIDAAMMAQQAQPGLVIPCHYWMFAEHGGDPAAFLYACEHFCPGVRAVLLAPGEGITWSGR